MGERPKAPKRDNRELDQANEILRKAAAERRATGMDKAVCRRRVSYTHRKTGILAPAMTGEMTLDRFLMLPAFVGVAGVQRVAHPFQSLVVEAKPAEQ
jgi:hypothetical protein